MKPIWECKAVLNISADCFDHRYFDQLLKMPLGLYISVPFCRTKCSYCNFASGVFSASQMAHYVERLSADVRAIRGFAKTIARKSPNRWTPFILGAARPACSLRTS